MFVIRRLNLVFRKNTSVDRMSSVKSAMINHRLVCASYSTEPAREHTVLKSV